MTCSVFTQIWNGKQALYYHMCVYVCLGKTRDSMNVCAVYAYRHCHHFLGHE